MKFNYSIIIFLFITCTSCKHDVAGCADPEATNRSFNANLNDGSCKYKPLILNPSFESGNGDWSTYTGSGFSPFAYATNNGDGFMPTSGQYFFKCIPTINYSGTSTKQFLNPNKHYKGFYFDYSYIGIARYDSVLSASCGIGISVGLQNFTLWYKIINEDKFTYGDFPNIKIQKKDEYVELPFMDRVSELFVSSSVTKGTFTFQIDNIREVTR